MPNHNLSESHDATKLWYWAVVLVLALICFRLASLGLYPLYDTTEARYGEIARLMYETQNWVTPQFDYGIPFWGKPPFHTWISAGSFSLLGVSEFAARMPHFICGLITCFLVYRFTLSLTNKQGAIFSLLVLTSSLGFIIAIGMVMTDSALLMAYTLAMLSFWHSYNQYSAKLYGHLFFAALALGMLIKGPVAVVLIVIALLVWSLWQGCFLRALRSLPWKTGMPLFALLTLPWYFWAEQRTPGFLSYFIVGEHIQRFLEPGWQGDLYGSAHNKPRGMIWLFWLACAFPWSFVLLKRLTLGIKKHALGNKAFTSKPINSYLIAWMLAPLLLFSLAGNILPIYVLPGFGAMAILIAVNNQLTRMAHVNALLTLVIIVLVFTFGLTKSSESELLANEQANFKEHEIYYWQHRPFSAQFYSGGNAKLLTDTTQLQNLVASGKRFYLALAPGQYQGLSGFLEHACGLEKSVANRSLYACHHD